MEAKQGTIYKLLSNVHVLNVVYLYLKLSGIAISIWMFGYMGFSLLWILIAVFLYLIYERNRKKRNLIISTAKAIGTNEKEAILCGVQSLPSWVFFPDVERAEWLNHAIQRFWPYASLFVQDIFKETIEPLIVANLPETLKPFKFAKIDLGDVPPRIGGVKVYNDSRIQRDEIVLDVDVQHYSDAQFHVVLRGLPAGVKDVEIRGTVRVILKPLISKFPLFGAITVTLLNNPFIDFNMTDLGNVLDIPGVSDLFRIVIRDVVSSLLVLPNRLPIRLLKGTDLIRLQYPLPQGLLRIHVVGAENLEKADMVMFTKVSSDPYCILRVGAQKFQTKVIKRNINPTWNEHFEAIVADTCQVLEIEVFDKDPGNKSDFIGRCSIDLESVYLRGTLDSWIVLRDVKTGRIHLKLTWLELSDSRADMDRELTQVELEASHAGAFLSTAFLHVVVDSAKNLKMVTRKRDRKLEEPSPYVELNLGNKKVTTSSRPYTPNPVWEVPYDFIVSNPEVDSLLLKIKDKRTDSNLGLVSIPLKPLLAMPGMHSSQPYPLSDAGSRSGADPYVVLHLELKALVPGQKRASQLDGLDIQGTGAGEEVDLSDEDATGTLTSRSRQATASIRRQASQMSPPQSPSYKIQKNESNAGSSPPRNDIDSPEKTSPSGNSIPSSPVNHRIKLRHRQSARVANSSAGTAGDGQTSYDSVSINSSRLGHSQGNLHYGRLKVTLRYSVQRLCLAVVVHGAENLVGCDVDPYVKLSILPKESRQVRRKTQVIKNNNNPVYDETFELPMNPTSLQKSVLRLDVKNHVGPFSRNRRLGYVELPLQNCDQLQPATEWHDIRPPEKTEKASTDQRSSLHSQVHTEV